MSPDARIEMELVNNGQLSTEIDILDKQLDVITDEISIISGDDKGYNDLVKARDRIVAEINKLNKR